MITLRIEHTWTEKHETLVHFAVYKSGKISYKTQTTEAPKDVLYLHIDAESGTYSVFLEDGTPLYCLGDMLGTRPKDAA